MRNLRFPQSRLQQNAAFCGSCGKQVPRADSNSALNTWSIAPPGPPNQPSHNKKTTEFIDFQGCPFWVRPCESVKSVVCSADGFYRFIEWFDARSAITLRAFSASSFALGKSSSALT